MYIRFIRFITMFVTGKLCTTFWNITWIVLFHIDTRYFSISHCYHLLYQCVTNPHQMLVFRFRQHGAVLMTSHGTLLTGIEVLVLTSMGNGDIPVENYSWRADWNLDLTASVWWWSTLAGLKAHGRPFRVATNLLAFGFASIYCRGVHIHPHQAISL